MGCTVTVSSRKNKSKWPTPKATLGLVKDTNVKGDGLEKRSTPRNWTNVAVPGSGGGGSVSSIEVFMSFYIIPRPYHISIYS